MLELWSRDVSLDMKVKRNVKERKLRLHVGRKSELSVQQGGENLR